MSVLVKINAPSPLQHNTDDASETSSKQRRPSAHPSNKTDEEGGKQSLGMNLFRRRSTFKGIATCLLGMRRMTKSSITATEDTKPKVQMENTYKTSPDEGTQFKERKVQETVNDLLDRELRNEVYNQERCKNLACDLSVKIKTRVKNMGFPRYKIIVNVVIGQCLNQGVEMASQCIWSPDTDNVTCCSYKNNSMFAVAVVHAVYYE